MVRVNYTVKQLKALGTYTEWYGDYALLFYVDCLDGSREYIHVTDLHDDVSLIGVDTRLQKFTTTKTARSAAQKDIRAFCVTTLKGLEND